MLKWPLQEETIVHPDKDGEMATYVLVPAGWTKTLSENRQVE
jgi:hypothetical protein